MLKVPEFSTWEERDRYMAAVAQAFDEWEQAHLDDAPPMRGNHKAGSNYPLHHLTVDATGAQVDDFERRIEELLTRG